MTHQPNNTMTMREAMARAICRQHNLDEGFSEEQVDSPMFQELDANFLKCADAVLAAMREPTEAMLDAGQNAMPAAAGYDLPDDCPRVWQAMIDAAKDGA